MAAPTSVHVRLTARQEQILRAIDAYKEERGYPPTARDLTRMVGLSSVATTHVHLTVLRDKGAVEWCAGLPRTLRITSAGYDALDKRVL
jgi:repressor LexA